MALNIIFAGTPDFAAHHLQALIDSEHQLLAVYTQPDRPAGRGKKLTPSAVKSLALKHQLPVEQPITLKESSAQETLRQYNADVMIVVAYGLLLPQIVLDTPRYGCLNVHGSLLPRWRGAAPIQRAIERGDSETGITIMQMDKGLDTGAMLSKKVCTIEPTETSASLHDKLMHLGAPALLDVLSQMQNQTLVHEQQNDHLASYAEKISKQEALVQWHHSALIIERTIRAFNPFPIAYTFLPYGEQQALQRIKIYDAEVYADDKQYLTVDDQHVGQIVAMDNDAIIVRCGEQYLAIKTLQIPGKKAMTVSEIRNGYSDRFTIGQCFTSA